MHMMGEIVVVMAPFLAFSSIDIVTKAQNKLTLMLDLHFKSLDV
jgi:hypothetical protein